MTTQFPSLTPLSLPNKRAFILPSARAHNIKAVVEIKLHKVLKVIDFYIDKTYIVTNFIDRIYEPYLPNVQTTKPVD